VLREEWRGLKVPGHVEDVLKTVKTLKKTGAVPPKEVIETKVVVKTTAEATPEDTAPVV
jgi:hypothetical protein